MSSPPEIPPTTERTTCRLCGSSELSFLFSLGTQYVNDFPEKDKAASGIQAPLEMVFCEKCTLVQLKHTAPQELLYRGFYWYKSSVTDTMKLALRDITRSAERFGLHAGDVVLDIGSNDGTLLRSYQVPGLITVGVEPAKNLAEEGRQGITHFINDFWTIQNYTKTIGKKAKIVTAIGMFYDMEDPNTFVKDAADALTDNGVFIAQLMCAKNMLDNNDVGNICHEHLEYYSFAALEFLFNKNGLEIFDVEINDVNGKSYRIFARKKGTFRPLAFPVGCEERVKAVKEDEHQLATKQPYLDFFNRIEEQKNNCVRFINQELAKGKRVWVYGASTKGNVILQYYGLDNTKIDGASERSSWKFGRYTVGTNIPIVSEEEARDCRPDYFLVLPYTFFNEMYEREKNWLVRGGKFIVPLPEFKVVGMENGQRKERTANHVIESPVSKIRETAPVSNMINESGKQQNGGKKKALILGITGQDGSYLAEVLLEKGYEVHGFIRRSATGNTTNIQHFLHRIILHKGDLADPTSIYRAIIDAQPDEIYNEADQDHVSWSYGAVGYSMDITGAAVGRILEIIKQINPKIKYFQPVSSNMFGIASNPQTEETNFRPQSPYACAKVLAYVMCRYYRDVFKMFVSTGIFYNHESPRRTEEYVTRKITKAAARISKGLQQKVSLGNLDAKIDWGYAKEYMEAAWNIMQLDQPADFIICTGEVHSLQEFLDEAFRQVGLNAVEHVEFDPRFARPGNTSVLIGDYSKAQRAFGFEPRYRFKKIVQMMVEHDLKEAEKELQLHTEKNHDSFLVS